VEELARSLITRHLSGGPRARNEDVLDMHGCPRDWSLTVPLAAENAMQQIYTNLLRTGCLSCNKPA
jgi:hypothetical protein